MVVGESEAVLRLDALKLLVAEAGFYVAAVGLPQAAGGFGSEPDCVDVDHSGTVALWPLLSPAGLLKYAGDERTGSGRACCSASSESAAHDADHGPADHCRDVGEAGLLPAGGLTTETFDPRNLRYPWGAKVPSPSPAAKIGREGVILHIKQVPPPHLLTGATPTPLECPGTRGDAVPQSSQAAL
ncbi:hypothetical protein Aple_080950 [Acrocarpospora pleiomorpha]|uniref:Uncharacterized protein n=1 Tax=Acrocarpospora pleiomorpha TaxID=90975 RepID=A0A5M3XW78_9ACTN|nr:hypothetical protein Aple_080950 [Acrocarpospora pleiomorpha]